MNNNDLKTEITILLRNIVVGIVNCKYVEVLEGGIGSRLKAEWMEEVIREYPDKLTTPPDEAFKTFDLYEVHGENEVIVDFFLWANFKQSDLMIKVVFYTSLSRLNYCIWDILVP